MLVFIVECYTQQYPKRKHIGGITLTESVEITHVCIHPNKHHSYSDVFGSREPSVYVIGRPDGSPMKLYNVGYDEAVSLVTTLPEELLEVVKAHYGLIEGEPRLFVAADLTPEQLEEVKNYFSLVDVEFVTDVTEDGLLSEEELVKLLNVSGMDVTLVPDPALDEAPVNDEVLIPEEVNDITLMELPQLRSLAKQLEIKNYHSKGKTRLMEEITAILDAAEEDN